MNLPNKLTVLRICMIPLFIAAYFLPYFWGAYVAVGIFVLAAFTDFLDGYIARKYHLVTDLGKLLDPIADKILVTAALFCVAGTNPIGYLSVVGGLSVSLDLFGIIFLVCSATVILARELLISAVRMIAASKGIVVQANMFGKIKTVFQDVSLPLLVLLNVCQVSNSQNSFWFGVGIVAMVLFGCATLMTIVSGIIYLVQNKSVFTSKTEQVKE